MSGKDRPLIVAEATPGGRGAISVVRWSGEGLEAHLSALFPRVRRSVPRRAALATLEDEEGPVDSGLLTRFDRGASFTGEASAEWSLHGSPPLVRRAIEAALRNGARLAEPGEFTRRAYLSGRLSIGEVEAIGEIGRSVGRHDAARAASALAEGRGADRLAEWKRALLAALATVEGEIDFAESDGVEVAANGAIASLLGGISGALSEAIREPSDRGVPRVVLVGRTNAGKSTIFNRLVGEEVAIVSPEPGTTRDAVREWISIDGAELELVDTAGDGGGDGELAQRAIARSREEERTADVLLVVLGPAEGSPERRTELGRQRLSGRAGVVVVAQVDGGAASNGGSGAVHVSARTGNGWNEFKQCLIQTIKDRLDRDSSTRYFGPWRRERLRRAEHAVLAASQTSRPEIAAEELRFAVEQLQAAEGTNLTEEMLDELFRGFCIGK